MKVLVCGGRDFRDYNLLSTVLYAEDLFRDGISQIIHGGARGADTLAKQWAREHNPEIPCRVFLADWEKHGRSAGPIRNQLMLKEGRPDLVIAFPGGRGTADMVARAKKAGIKVETITE
jgi:hypothetical protein